MKPVPDVYKQLFPAGVTCEVISVTKGVDGPAAAPLGVTRKGSVLAVRVFHDTRSYRNIVHTQTVTLNVTRDALAFYRVMYNGTRLVGSLLAKGDFLVLAGAEAWVGAKLLDEKDEPEIGRSQLTLQPVSAEVGEPVARAYTRADAALLEMLVHSTRIRPFITQKKRGEAEHLVSLMEHYESLLSRIARNTHYHRAAKRLLREAHASLRGE